MCVNWLMVHVHWGMMKSKEDGTGMEQDEAEEGQEACEMKVYTQSTVTGKKGRKREYNRWDVHHKRPQLVLHRLC